MAYYYKPQQLMDHIHDLLTDHKSDLGIGYVGYADEQLLPYYPAVLVDSGPINRELQATHQFGLIFHLALWIYHAKLDDAHADRSKADMELCHLVTELLHSDLTLGGNVIFGYVTEEMPGIFHRPSGPTTIGTRLSYEATARKVF